MEKDFLKDGGEFMPYKGSARDNHFPFDDSVGGMFDPKNKVIHLFYAEERNLSFKAEELGSV